MTRLPLWGPLTAVSAMRARAMIRRYASEGRSVLVDLTAVGAIDACGIAALLDGLRTIQAQHGTMLVRANAVVERALKASGTIAAFRLVHG